jgi:hypothetical protein
MGAIAGTCYWMEAEQQRTLQRVAAHERYTPTQGRTHAWKQARKQRRTNGGRCAARMHWLCRSTQWGVSRTNGVPNECMGFSQGCWGGAWKQW